MKNSFKKLLFFLSAILLISCENKTTANPEPATIEQATQTIDLSKLPMLAGASTPRQSTLANLSYQVHATVSAVYEFYKKQLNDQGWKELEHSYVSEPMASAAYMKNGFKLSLTAIANSNLTDVVLQQHGNVNLEKIKLQPGLTLLTAFPLTAIYVSPASVDETITATKTALSNAGWSLYGSAGPTLYFKKNAVKLNVMINPAPAQQNQTAINLSDSLLSADLPVPPDSENHNYNDLEQYVTFSSKKTKAEIFEFYRQTMTAKGWKQSAELTDKTEILPFRNQSSDLFTIALGNAPENTIKAIARFQSAAQVAAMNKILDAQAAAHKAQNP